MGCRISSSNNENLFTPTEDSEMATTSQQPNVDYKARLERKQCLVNALHHKSYLCPPHVRCMHCSYQTINTLVTFARYNHAGYKLPYTTSIDENYRF